MSDRDSDLTGLFVRDIDQIDVPPRATWRPVPSRSHWSAPIVRPLAFVAGTAIMLVLALAAGMSLRERGVPATSPEPSPQATATLDVAASATPRTAPTESATASPAATPQAATAILDERFGFVVYNDTVRVRSETGGEVSTLPVDTQFAGLIFVSPDGRSVAYWQPATGTPVLYVRSVAGGDPRVVFTGKSGWIGFRVAWSPDGTGLVVGLQPARVGPGPGSPSSEVWTIDLASGAKEQIASRGDGWVWAPVSWDRDRKLVAAGLTGEGGGMTSYEIIDLGQASGTRCDAETPCPYAIRATPIKDETRGFMRTSSDGRYVLVEMSSGDTMWWPVAEPERRSTITGASQVQWRPGSHEIWWVGGLEPAGCVTVPCAGTELVAYDVATGARVVKFRGSYLRGVAGFRADGSAVITISHGCAGPECTTTEAMIVELEQGRTEKFTIDGRLGVLVRLR